MWAQDHASEYELDGQAQPSEAPPSTTNGADAPCNVDDDDASLGQWSTQLFGQALTCRDVASMGGCTEGDHTASIRAWCPRSCQTDACRMGGDTTDDDVTEGTDNPRVLPAFLSTFWFSAALVAVLAVVGVVYVRQLFRRTGRVRIVEVYDIKDTAALLDTKE